MILIFWRAVTRARTPVEMPRRAPARCLLMMLLLGGCAKDLGSPHQHLTPVWREYLEMPDQRALAIAGDPRKNHWVSAASGGHSTSSAAQENALEQCRLRRRIRRLQPACVLYAIDDQIVWRGP